MKTLTMGTTNPAKIAQIAGALKPLHIEVQGLPKDIPLPEVVEDGSTAEENARKKAVTYAQALGQIVFSMDNSLHFEGLPPEQQPGIFVRRIPGITGRASDEEMLTHYMKVIDGLGGQAYGYWGFAICVANPNGKIYETTIKSHHLFTSKPCTTRIPGYPLEAITIKDPATGKYAAEMTQEEQDIHWQHAIGEPLCEFIQSIEF